jgi:DUF1680 family protein
MRPAQQIFNLGRAALVMSVSLLPAMRLPAQAIQSQSAVNDPGVARFEIAASLPQPAAHSFAPGDVTLLSGLFQQRREATKAYVHDLQTRNLLQNHRLEAGLRDDRASAELHQGWEAPHYQLRGHFAGHWLSAAAWYAAIDHDAVLGARAAEMVDQLAHCQELNGAGWVGSVPTQYFDMLEQGRAVWSPQYTLHKTLMGLYDAWSIQGNDTAGRVLLEAAGWFDAWTARLVAAGRGEVVYGGESAGMLELWTDLYAATDDRRHLDLAARYAKPDLFAALVEGGDPLTNDHANASVPWIHGAARLYEVTGDARYREVVEAFWRSAVETRGMFATTGNNAGEFWIPPQQFGRFLGSRTQEHCTVYNMIRVADYLLRWTGESRYADYIERALYNGILAQHHPHTGLISYFLPLEPGARKVWGTATADFWCCHGTLVQAQARHESFIYQSADDGLMVSQFIPSTLTWGEGAEAVSLMQRIDASGGRQNFVRADAQSRWVVDLAIAADLPREWTLRVRRPEWAIGAADVRVNGEPVEAVLNANGYLELTRSWAHDRVQVTFTKSVRREPLPGDPSRFALLDGPVVLAAVADGGVVLDPSEPLTPQYEHVYEAGRDWLAGHYLASTPAGDVHLKPLHEIIDEAYTVYFSPAE